MQRNHRKENNFFSKKNTHYLPESKYANSTNQHRHFQGQHITNESTEHFICQLALKTRWKFNLNNPRYIFLLFLYSSVILQVSASENNNIQNLITNKTILDENVSPEACAMLQNKIVETIEMQEFDNDHMRYVLEQPDFQIKCIDKSDSRTSFGFASFNAGSKAINFYDPVRATHAHIRHEFYHAHNFFSHKNGKCNGTTNIEMISPVYPRTEMEMTKYHEAFDKGDARLDHFIKLMNKNTNGRLTKKEKELYNKYLEVLNKCLPIKYKYSVKHPEELEMLRKDNNALYYSMKKQIQSSYVEEPAGIRVLDLEMENDEFKFSYITTNALTFAKKTARRLQVLS